MLIIKPPYTGKWDNYNKTWSDRNDRAHDVYICFKNEYAKPIKYIIFSVVAFDRVHEPLTCEFNNGQVEKIKYTGPLNTNEITSQIWEDVFFDNDIAYVKVVKIEITFMDETKTKINEFDIQIDEDLGNELIENKKGCYIATCVYGSYDCPEVWTLRRFRDLYLNNKKLGKLFVKAYYYISPKLVKNFGEKKWFRKTWKFLLNNFVKLLNKKGYKSAHYED